MRTFGARPQVGPKAGHLTESTPAASHNQCPCQKRRRNDRLARRALQRPKPDQPPISPPVQSNFGGRNTSVPPKPACQEQSGPSQHARAAEARLSQPLPPVRGNSMPGTTQCRKFSDLGHMFPPDPPRTSWLPTAGGDPDPGRLKRPQVPGRPRGDSTCQEIAATSGSRSFEDDSARQAIAATSRFSRRWTSPRP